MNCISRGARRLDGKAMVGIIRDRFVGFLEKGLATGDAGWPRP